MTSINQLVRADARRAILQLLAEDRGYSMNDAILRSAVDRLTAVTLSPSEMREHLAWLEDRGAVTTERVPPYVLAKLTDKGLALAQGHETLDGVSRPTPSQV